MGNQQSIQKLNFEDIQQIIKTPENYILINTLDKDLQECLIPNTINVNNEELIINNLLSNDKTKNIIIYGKNVNDPSIYERYEQLIKLGFNNLYVYPGGMFEWLCLQDIYSDELFPTNKKEMDILKYKPSSQLNKYCITNGID
jgi:rhodanese-related sulfurtransferase|tara:strand:- start:5723 stop:6151 length:429 start_codon:yes stop_codon:yes gene_type:complete